MHVFILFLVPSGCLDELEGIRHFESAFRHRHRTASRWPGWFKSTLENALNQPVEFAFFVFF